MLARHGIAFLFRSRICLITRCLEQTIVGDYFCSVLLVSFPGAFVLLLLERDTYCSARFALPWGIPCICTFSASAASKPAFTTVTSTAKLREKLNSFTFPGSKRKLKVTCKVWLLYIVLPGTSSAHCCRIEFPHFQCKMKLTMKYWICSLRSLCWTEDELLYQTNLQNCRRLANNADRIGAEESKCKNKAGAPSPEQQVGHSCKQQDSPDRIAKFLHKWLALGVSDGVCKTDATSRNFRTAASPPRDISGFLIIRYFICGACLTHSNGPDVSIFLPKNAEHFGSVEEIQRAFCSSPTFSYWDEQPQGSSKNRTVLKHT